MVTDTGAIHAIIDLDKLSKCHNRLGPNLDSHLMLNIGNPEANGRKIFELSTYKYMSNMVVNLSLSRAYINFRPIPISRILGPRDINNNSRPKLWWRPSGIFFSWVLQVLS